MNSMSPLARAALDRATGRQSQRRAWLVTDDALLRRLYPDTPMPALVARLARTPSGIYSRARGLDLRRSPDYLASEHACRLRRGGEVGKASQFKKGDVTWNAGMKGWQAGGHSAQTQFKPGHVSVNTAALGAERVTRDGIRQRKVLQDGPPSRRWKACHALLWALHHGPIPPGHIVIFRDHNMTRIEIDNLQLITRAENMRRNTIHRYPPELVSTIYAIGKLRRTIEDQK